MKISYKGDYAIKSLLFLAYKYEEDKGAAKYFQIHEISASQDIPLKFLEQIMLILKNAGYLKSLRGKNGGYSIAKKPEDIKLGEILRLIDGPISPIACVSRSNHNSCNFEERCVLQPIWAEVGSAISNIVDNITFKDLAKREYELLTNKNDAIVYQI